MVVATPSSIDRRLIPAAFVGLGLSTVVLPTRKIGRRRVDPERAQALFNFGYYQMPDAQRASANQYLVVSSDRRTRRCRRKIEMSSAVQSRDDTHHWRRDDEHVPQ